MGPEVVIATLLFTAFVTESRREALLKFIQSIPRGDVLSPGVASILIGRLNSRVGRAPLCAVFARQELCWDNNNVGSSKATSGLTRLLRAAGVPSVLAARPSPSPYPHTRGSPRAGARVHHWRGPRVHGGVLC